MQALIKIALTVMAPDSQHWQMVRTIFLSQSKADQEQT